MKMSYTTTYSAPRGAGLMGKLSNVFEAYATHRADQRAVRQTYKELSAMNDRDLADIGVARGEIRHIASQAKALR